MGVEGEGRGHERGQHNNCTAAIRVLGPLSIWPARTGNGREGSSKFCVPWLTLRLFLGFLPAPRPSWSLSRSAASPLAAILLRSTTLLPLASIAPGAVVVVVVVAVAVAPVAFRSLIAVVYAQSFSPQWFLLFQSRWFFFRLSLFSLRYALISRLLGLPLDLSASGRVTQTSRLQIIERENRPSFPARLRRFPMAQLACPKLCSPLWPLSRQGRKQA